MTFFSFDSLPRDVDGCTFLRMDEMAGTATAFPFDWWARAVGGCTEASVARMSWRTGPVDFIMKVIGTVKGTVKIHGAGSVLEIDWEKQIFFAGTEGLGTVDEGVVGGVELMVLLNG